MSYTAATLLDVTRESLREIGYQPSLLIGDYQFVDVLTTTSHIRQVPLAAFAQDPPSYRNACFGVVLPPTAGAEQIVPFRSLGAPQVLALHPSQGDVHRWKIVANGPPEWLERIEAANLRQRILAERENWSPDNVLRAKSIGIGPRPAQLDFYDLGLLPALEREVQIKLDQLLRDAIWEAEQLYIARLKSPLSTHATRELFRLVFRLVAAKLLTDRGHPGPWVHEDVRVVVSAIDRYYFGTSRQDSLSIDPAVQSLVWDRIRHSLHLQNVSVEALAYVYENTLVSEETRRAYDTHATPPEIAEYVVRQLPFEILERNERRVFEPFAGHAPFLIAALGRLRTLLPASMRPQERHNYFVEMLSGMEIDSFAVEVARYSLMLADYPNPNGWRLDNEDVFSSDLFNQRLRESKIVLSNPPYGPFMSRSKGLHANKAVEAVTRILAVPPQMLGLVLPRVFVNGQSYRAARRLIAERYSEVRTIWLEDVGFQHSDVESAIVVGFNTEGRQQRIIAMYVRQQDYARFVQTGVPTWRTEVAASPESLAGATASELWPTPLTPVWSALDEYPRFGRFALDIARGVEYRISLRDHRADLISDRPRQGFQEGLFNVSEGFEPFVALDRVYLRIEPELMLYKAHQRPWSEPKIIANAHRLTRGPWPLAAVVDRSGLVCYQNFHGIWPTGELPLEVMAAVLNGPVANAYLDTHVSSRRDNHKRVIADIPVPILGTAAIEAITALVNAYVEERLIWLQENVEAGEARCRVLLEQIDAELLKAYSLPPRLERALLDYFAGAKRPGPVDFTGYYAPDFMPAIPWALYISDQFKHASVSRTLKRLPRLYDAAISSVLEELE